MSRLEEVCEVLEEQYALVQINLPSSNLPAITRAAHRIDPLADEGALFIFVPVPIEHKAALHSHLIRTAPVQNADIRNEVRDTRVGLIRPVDVRADLRHALL